MEFRGSITGVEEVLRTFDRLPRSTGRKTYNRSLRAGAEIVRSQATENIKSVSDPYSGLARRLDTLRVYNLKKYKGNYRVAVHVRRGLTNPVKMDKEGKPVRVGLYLSVLEYGSQKLNRAPRPWLRKAIREKESQAASKVKSEFYKLFDDAVKDARGK